MKTMAGELLIGHYFENRFNLRRVLVIHTLLMGEWWGIYCLWNKLAPPLKKNTSVLGKKI